MRYYIVDAFTDQPFRGNPAGVALLEGNTFPKEELMLKIAAELRYSETAFVRRHSESEYTLRYFTPRTDILQGETMGRPSVVATRITPGGTIFVGGTAYILASGDLHLEALCTTLG